MTDNRKLAIERITSNNRRAGAERVGAERAEPERAGAVRAGIVHDGAVRAAEYLKHLCFYH